MILTQGISFVQTYLQEQQAFANQAGNLPIPGVGMTQIRFVNFSISSFILQKQVIFLESHSYSTSVTVAELRGHLSNIGLIFIRERVFWQRRQFRKLREQRKLA